MLFVVLIGGIMIRIFVTGDNHIGKKYSRYEAIKDELIKSRFASLDNMVKKAEQERCSIFVVTGDLFDNVSSIKTSDVKQVVDILAGFSGNVLVLPGNHDYYTGEEKLWKDFEKYLNNRSHNITILSEYRTYELEIGDETAVIYPAYCQSKHSKENNLGWIKESDIAVNSAGTYNIGIAHGAIEGITPDMKEEYFLMSESELNSIPVDAWLIGHTHIQYPSLKENEVGEGYKIFNPGTHEQIDLHNNTEGVCFIVELDNSRGVSTTKVNKIVSGQVRYYDMKLVVKSDSDKELYNSIDKLVVNIDSNSVVRINMEGSLKEEEYKVRGKIYEELLGRFKFYEVDDSELSEEITVEKIRSEYSELSFAAQFMEKLMDNPVELQMAYQLVNRCKE